MTHSSLTGSRFVVAGALILILVGSSQRTAVSSDDNEPDTLTRLKDATVLIKVFTNKGTKSGSGFLWEVTGEDGVVVTNAHVIEHDNESLRGIECYFHSGTKKEFMAKAEVVGTDPISDLAMLAVKRHSLPAAIPSNAGVKVRETMPVMVLGFPFGDVLATSSRNPAITVTKASISSIRRDDYDNIVLLQIDGGIHPGNSGGPMVTEDGTLLGISVAKVRGTTIGFAIPQQMLTESVRGRVSGIEVKEIGNRAPDHTYRVVAACMDPKHNLVSASLVAFTAENQTIKAPDKEGRWRLASQKLLDKQDLKIFRTSATWNLTLRAKPSETMLQISWKRKDGTEEFTAPTKISVERKPSPAEVSPPEVPVPDVTQIVSDCKFVELPATMFDFALNPQTGDLAAVDPFSNRAVLLRENSLSAGRAELGATAGLGKTPIGIAYKQFKGHAYFLATCAEDSQMYVLDAEEFELVKKIPLTGKDISSVRTSSNPDDPFVYYNYGVEHGSKAGVVDLREMVDRGEAFDKSSDCAISADGHYAYRRGPWSPSGFESLQLRNQFEDPKPIFTRHFYDHQTRGPYTPDPFGEYTAVDSALYSKGLERQVAPLKLELMCFFRSKPILVGFQGSNLRAASYNSFSIVGVGIPLPPPLVSREIRLLKGEAPNPKLRGVRPRLLADDKNSRVIFAVGNRLGIMSLRDLRLPDEPFMLLNVGPTELRVGKSTLIEISPRDSRVSIDMGTLPEGAKRVAKGIEWTPNDESVGTATVAVTLKYEEIERDVNIELHVNQPFVESPIEFAGAWIDDAATSAICWTGPQLARSSKMKRQSPDDDTQPNHYLFVLPFRTGTGGELTKKAIPYTVTQVVAVGNYVVVQSAANNSGVEIHDIKSLERLRTLSSSSTLKGISAAPGQLILQGTTTIDVYDTNTFKKLSTTNLTIHPGLEGKATRTVKDGIVADGVLYDSRGEKLKLVLSPNKIPDLRGADPQLYSGSFLRGFQQGRNAASSNAGLVIVAGPISIPGRGVSVSLEKSVVKVDVPGATHTWKLKREASLVVTDPAGARLSRIRIINESIPADEPQSTPMYSPMMQVVGDYVFVYDGKRIYRWSTKGIPKSESPKNEESVEFHVVPAQSAFVLDPDLTQLKHVVKGGRAPYKFTSLVPVDGMSIDQNTGVVTIESIKLLQGAIPSLSRYAAGASDLEEIEQKLQAATIDFKTPAMKILGRKPNGFPLAIPIHFKVVDSLGSVAEMQYFMLMEAPYSELADLLQQRREGKKARP